ncbi:MAG: hypothetical protein Q7T82_16880 [Armatimonadota bacterium]|nr:hypothetical protein [Armatimonadota bacterium]
MRKVFRYYRLAPLMVVFLAICALEPVVDASYAASGLSRATQGESAAYALAGEFRSVIANFLWIKVERYHHEFIQTNADWRANKDMLPLIKMITDLDPHFTEAYLCGSWMLSMGLDRPDEGIAFAKEGVRNNPDNMAVNEIVGTIYARKLKQPSKALPYLRRALQLSADDWDRRRMRRLIRTVRRMQGDLTTDQHR